MRINPHIGEIEDQYAVQIEDDYTNPGLEILQYNGQFIVTYTLERYNYNTITGVIRVEKDLSVYNQVYLTQKCEEYDEHIPAIKFRPQGNLLYFFGQRLWFGKLDSYVQKFEIWEDNEWFDLSGTDLKEIQDPLLVVSPKDLHAKFTSIKPFTPAVSILEKPLELKVSAILILNIYQI